MSLPKGVATKKLVDAINSAIGESLGVQAGDIEDLDSALAAMVADDTSDLNAALVALIAAETA
jgi:hypothetical protein